MTAEEIVTEALKLEPKSRSRVAAELLRSLEEVQEELSEEECEKAWLEVSERRAQEMREGKVKGNPGEEVFARARAFLSS